MDAFTLFHVVLSLIGIGSGFVFLAGLLRSRSSSSWTALFLATTAATSVTGFLFPFHGVTPAIIFGVVSVVLLSLAIFALYVRHLDGGWRKTFVVTSLTAQYLNVFVLVVQSFQKIPALNALAPTQSETPFAIAQLVVLIAMVVLGVRATKAFRAPTLRAASAASR